MQRVEVRGQHTLTCPEEGRGDAEVRGVPLSTFGREDSDILTRGGGGGGRGGGACVRN